MATYHVLINGKCLDSFEDSYRAAAVSRWARRKLYEGGWKVRHQCKSTSDERGEEQVSHIITAIKQ